MAEVDAELMMVGRRLLLDHGAALSMLRRIAVDRGTMRDLRRLCVEELGRSSLHTMRDEAVLTMLAERIARGHLSVTLLSRPERPGPQEGDPPEAGTESLAAAAAAAAAATAEAAAEATEASKPTATISDPQWSAKRVAVGGEVKATFKYAGFVDDKSVTMTFFETNADGTRKKVHEKAETVKGPDGVHEYAWTREPDEAQKDLEEDAAEGDTGPVEYVFTAESKKAGHSGDSGPLWLTNTVTVNLEDEEGSASDKPLVVVLKDHEKELRAKAEGGKATFEKVLVGPIQVRLAKPQFTKLAWAQPKVPVGEAAEGVFAYEDAIEGMKVSVFVHEFNADGTSTEVEKAEVTLEKDSGEAKFSFTRTEDEAQEDMALDEREGDTGPLEYRYYLTTEDGHASDASEPLFLTHTVSLKLENAEDGAPFPDGMELVIVGADGAEHRGKLAGGEAKFEGVVCGPMIVKLAPKGEA